MTVSGTLSSPHTSLLALRLGDSCIGSSVTFKFPRARLFTSDMHGLDHAKARPVSAYFVMLAQCVKHALREGMDFVDFGPTTLQPKVAIGATLIDCRAGFFCGNPLLNVFIRMGAQSYVSHQVGSKASQAILDTYGMNAPSSSAAAAATGGGAGTVGSTDVVAPVTVASAAGSTPVATAGKRPLDSSGGSGTVIMNGSSSALRQASNRKLPSSSPVPARAMDDNNRAPLFPQRSAAERNEADHTPSTSSPNPSDSPTPLSPTGSAAPAGAPYAHGANQSRTLGSSSTNSTAVESAAEAASAAATAGTAVAGITAATVLRSAPVVVPEAKMLPTVPHRSKRVLRREEKKLLKKVLKKQALAAPATSSGPPPLVSTMSAVTAHVGAQAAVAAGSTGAAMNGVHSAQGDSAGTAPSTHG